MSSYRLDNKTGVVIGSMKPWVEVMALRHGANHVLTVEYNSLNIQKEFQDRLSSIHPVEFAKKWNEYVETFDFAASFSSIEHSGLGRYGDPIDPIGDMREMLKIKCILKKGGLLFLGFPMGTDAILYNAHRYYGPIRLALMLYGFELLDTFSGKSEQPIRLNSQLLHQPGLLGGTQYTMVLRKL
uniref:Methyltransf_11 domain-containing protein n=1 Tax=Caenorhabditis tropicalis TaxID=1561998 RepID=A0A1I7TAX0_9PELO